MKLKYLLTAALLAPFFVLGQATTTGFDNAARPEPVGTLISSSSNNDSLNGGRTTTLGYLGGWLVVGFESPGSRSGSDNRLRVYNIEDPSEPIRMFPSDFGQTYDSWHDGNSGWNAHAIAYVDNELWPDSIISESWGGSVTIPQAKIDFNANPNANNGPLSVYNRSALASPWAATLAWYGGSSGSFTLGRKFLENGEWGNTRTLSTFNHTGQYGGGTWHPMIFGDLLIYMRSKDGGNNGVVIYRMTEFNNFDNPANASVTLEFVSVLDDDLDAYWPNLYGYDRDNLYVVGTQNNNVELINITNAVDPSIAGNEITEVREDNPNTETLWYRGLSNATYPVYQDNYLFVHDFKIDLTSFLAGDPIENYVVLKLDEGANQQETSQMSLPLGNLWITGGYHKTSGNELRNQGMAVWVHQQAPDTRRPRVGYHIPQVERINYPRYATLSFLVHETPKNGGPQVGREFTVRKVNPDLSLEPSISGFTIMAYSGEVNFTPDTPLDADSTYEVEWFGSGNGFQDAAGNYIEPYTFRFSTGDTVIGGSAPAPVDTIPVLTDFIIDDYQPSIGQQTTLTTTATGDNLEYRFRVEGVWSAWSPSNTLNHTFNSEGRYLVNAEVQNSAGTVASSLQAVVINPPNPIAPTRSTTMASDGTNTWAVNPDNDEVMVVAASTGALVAEYDTCDHPRNIAVDNANRFWVTCDKSDEIEIFNSNGTLAQTITLAYGDRPTGIVKAPDNSAMYVSLLGSDRLAKIAISDFSISLADTFDTPRALAIDSTSNRIFVTRYISPKTHGEVAEYDSNLNLVRTFTLAPALLNDQPTEASGVPNHLLGIAISPDNLHAIVMSKQDNVYRGEAQGRLNHNFETRVRPIFSVLDLTTNEEIYEARKDFDNNEGPYDVAFTSSGDLAFMTLQGSNIVGAVDAYNIEDGTQHEVILRVSELTGLAPQGVLLDEVNNRLFTQNFTDRTVRTYDITSLLAENSSAIIHVATATATSDVLTAQELEGLQIFYNAADERMSAEGYLSCASCHLEGGSDQRVWDVTGLGEGFRRTTDLRGRASMLHGNLHWSGNFDELQDFEHDIRGPFGGNGFLPVTAAAFNDKWVHPSTRKTGMSPELDALAAYVATFTHYVRSPNRDATGNMTASATAGKTVFENLGCIDCHTGENFTKSAFKNVYRPNLENIGSIIDEMSGNRIGIDLFGIDVPTLRGLHVHPTYLHHGQVDEVAEVFSFRGGKFVDIDQSNAAVTTSTEFGGSGEARGMLNNTYATVSLGVTYNGVETVSGDGHVSVRYAASTTSDITVTVNGTPTVISANATTNLPNTHPSDWQWIQVPATLSEVNTIQISANNPVWIDGIAVSDADNEARSPYTVIDTLTATQQTDLINYLLSLDGSPDEYTAPVVTPTVVNATYELIADGVAESLTEGQTFANTYAIQDLNIRVIPDVDVDRVRIQVNAIDARIDRFGRYTAFRRGRELGSGTHIINVTFYIDGEEVTTTLNFTVE